MAWCHQATSHYLCQCWPSSMSPYGITRAQWVNVIWGNHKFIHIVEFQIRRWLRKIHSKKREPLGWQRPPGLTDQRRVELQAVIEQWRELHPVSVNLRYFFFMTVESCHNRSAYCVRADSRFVPSQWETCIQHSKFNPLEIWMKF